MKRKLTVKKETLTELWADELRMVAGGHDDSISPTCTGNTYCYCIHRPAITTLDIPCTPA